MKLLIVEDELKINNALAQGFKEEGFDVDSAFDGIEALDKINAYQYQCIILDLMLPEKDGMAVLKTIRHEKNYTPLIILTAKDAVEEKIKGLDGGADDYLAKPFSFYELLSRVKAIIRRYSSNEDILNVGTLTLNPFKKTVRRSNVIINLAAKDFRLLEYLMRHKGAVISEDQIIRHIWNYDFDITSNVVASHIKNLRQKIDKDFPREKRIFHTLRGLGYKIDE